MYAGNSAILICPSDKAGENGWSSLNELGPRDWWWTPATFTPAKCGLNGGFNVGYNLCSYGWNNQASGGSTNTQPCTGTYCTGDAACDYPADMWMIADAAMTDVNYGYASATTDGYNGWQHCADWVFRHNGVANFGFVDGHAGTLPSGSPPALAALQAAGCWGGSTVAIPAATTRFWTGIDPHP